MPKLKNAKAGLAPKPLLPAGRKRKGSRRERQVIATLEAQGYKCRKSGGSLGVWDVIGFGPEDQVLCQVKSNRFPSPAEVEGLELFDCSDSCIKMIVICPDRKPMSRWLYYSQMPGGVWQEFQRGTWGWDPTGKQYQRKVKEP